MARSPNEQQATAALIAEGRAALVAGEKSRAQALLQAAVRKEPDNVEAWLWLSGAHTAPDDIAYCLRKVLLLDPGNDQAREGLDWLAQTHGLTVPASLGATPPPSGPALPRPFSPIAHDTPPARSLDERQAERRVAALHAQQAATAADRAMAAARVRAFEMVFYVGGVGAVVGMLRLLGVLRPASLLIIRGSAGPIVALDAFLVALATAVLHGLVLILGWLLLSWSLGRVRNDRQGAVADTLEQVGRVLLPGYGLFGGVVLTALSLGWSEQRWLPVVGLICAFALASLALIGRRLVQLFDLFRIPQYRRTMHFIRLVGPPVVVVVAGFVAAGLALRALLQAL